ncbi:MAG: glycosyltransferase family 4 protein [Oscillatoria sp. PMC 1068.18]|nr:glycosyltransferase family 4 protein [Oscillatoria sp. PMC 1076.18]MEC4989697.1 glycosyltransferase family 4 protein [Oscillatoria sp. PMC 1068.18]
MTIKILHILPVADRGGAERMHLSWIASLQKQFIFQVILPKQGSLQKDLEKLGITVLTPKDFRMKNLFQVIKILKNYINSESINLIHSSMKYGHLFGSLANLASSNCREIWSNHGPMSHNYYQGVIPLLPSTGILLPSNYMYNLQRRSLYNATNLYLVPNGVDTNLIIPQQQNRYTLQNKYELTEDTLAIGIIGRINKWKGQDIFLKAIKNLQTHHRKVKFFIIGGAVFGVGKDYQAELLELTHNLGLEKQVIFTGHVDNVYEYYDLLDIVVHASIIPEPFGLVIAEAMAKEKIVVASQGGGASEMINHGINGFLYQGGNIQALSNQLSKLINFLDKYKTIGQNARKSIILNFSLEKSADCLQSTYLKILQK